MGHSAIRRFKNWIKKRRAIKIRKMQALYDKDLEEAEKRGIKDYNHLANCSCSLCKTEKHFKEKTLQEKKAELKEEEEKSELFS